MTKWKVYEYVDPEKSSHQELMRSANWHDERWQYLKQWGELKCVACGESDERAIDMHHHTYERGTLNSKPIPLCRPCHQKYHSDLEERGNTTTIPDELLRKRGSRTKTIMTEHFARWLIGERQQNELPPYPFDQRHTIHNRI